METFYVTYDKFWEWFDRENDSFQEEEVSYKKDLGQSEPASKRVKLDRIQPPSNATRYIILYGRHKPGKKNKTWECDGYLSLAGQTAHLCDLKGRMLEEPTLLDEVDYKLVTDLGELVIGNTEVQVIEIDKK